MTLWKCNRYANKYDCSVMMTYGFGGLWFQTDIFHVPYFVSFRILWKQTTKMSVFFDSIKKIEFFTTQNIWLVTSLIDSDAKKKIYEGELNGSDHIFKCQITFIFMIQKERQFILNLLSTVFYAIWIVPSDFLLFNEFILNSAFQQSVPFMFIRFVIFRFNPIHWYLCTHDEHRVTQSEHIYSIPVSIHCSHDVIHYSFRSKFKH